MRTQEEIMNDLMEGRLDPSQVTIAETATIDKIDMSGDVPRLFETVTVTKKPGQDADIHVVKH